MPGPFASAILFVAVMLAIGFALRSGVRVFRILYIPAAALAGLLGFAAVQAGLRIPAAQPHTATITGELSSWPGWLIAVVFAGLLLERSSNKGFGEALRRGVSSGVLAWIIILGQLVIGLCVYLVAVRPTNPDIPASFGQLLEVSWAGGHGTAAAMGEVYRALNFPQGRDLAFFLATIGLLWGVMSGLALVNIALRCGWVTPPAATADEQPSQKRAMGEMKCRSEVLDPLALQAVILAIAVGLGLIFQQGFIQLAGLVIGKDDPAVRGEAIDFLNNLPLFLFTLVGGLALRQAMRLLRVDHFIDSGSIARLVGLAIEVLIVAAISTMRVETLQAYLLPALALIVLAAIWCAFCLLVLARRLLPERYWFELGLLNYGFATANTPQGMMLLRIVDPEFKSGAAEDYAVAAPLSAPFVGGGVVTIVLLPLLLQQVSAGLIAAVLAALIVALYAIGRRLRC